MTENEMMEQKKDKRGQTELIWKYILFFFNFSLFFNFKLFKRHSRLMKYQP